MVGNTSKMSLANMLLIAQKIDNGLRDSSTRDRRFAPLWQHHFLRESFLTLLQSQTDHTNVEFHRQNFLNVCAIMCPEFSAILAVIELPQTQAA